MPCAPVKFCFTRTDSAENQRRLRGSRRVLQAGRAKEKEMVAYQLIQLVGKSSAADILGISMRELDSLVEIFEKQNFLSEEGDLESAMLAWADSKKAKADCQI